MCGESNHETVSLRTLQKIVANSAKKLDKTHKKWFKVINVGSLDQNFADLCIVGQLRTAGFSNLPSEMDIQRGFNIESNTDITNNGKVIAKYGEWSFSSTDNPPYKVLTRLWKHQIAVRVRKASQKRAAKRKPRKVASFPLHGC
jgi:hypothetical protein